MAESYSNSLKITLIGDGDLAGTWGDTTNTNWNLVEQAITGVDTLSAMGDSNYTLSNLNGTSDEARNQVIVIPSTTTLSATRYLYAPFVQKTYTIANLSSGGQSIYVQGYVSGTPTGSPLLVPNGVTSQVYCDGVTGFYPAVTGSAGNFVVNGTLSATGESDTGNLSVGGNLSVVGTISGVGTGLTGTASSFTAGTANALNPSNSYSVNGLTAAGNVYINGQRLINYDNWCTLQNPANGNGVRIVNQAYNAQIWGCDNSGNTTAAGNVTAYSDERLKTDIQTLTNALDTVNALRGVAFIKDGKAGIGVIAQEVQTVLPQVVQDNPDGYLSVAYGNIVGVLIEAVKELKAEVEELKRSK